jgi:3-oxoadipate enol-lactonase
MPHATHAGARIYWEESRLDRRDGRDGRDGQEAKRDPLLLIMGLGATLEWWYRLMPMLTTRYRTIVFDNRGVGRSDVTPGPYALPEMAADAAAVLDAAGVASAHVFGASMGGMIAQELALNHPARVRSLVLGCTACGGPQAVLAKPDVLAALAARATMTREQALSAMAPYIFDVSTPRERVAEDIAMWLRATVSNDGYFAQLQAIRSWSGTYDRLGGIAMPTLVIHGETDQLVPPENGRIIAQAIPDARLVMLPNASHLFFTDQSDASGEAILSFLDQASAETTASL